MCSRVLHRKLSKKVWTPCFVLVSSIVGHNTRRPWRLTHSHWRYTEIGSRLLNTVKGLARKKGRGRGFARISFSRLIGHATPWPTVNYARRHFARIKWKSSHRRQERRVGKRERELHYRNRCNSSWPAALDHAAFPKQPHTRYNLSPLSTRASCNPCDNCLNRPLATPFNRKDRGRSLRASRVRV